MLAYTYISHGKFDLIDKPKPELQDPRDTIVGDCIELRPILSDCKRRNPQNLAGSVPNVPTSANILTQKKEQKSLLLEFKYL